jgi:hypothetical protein
MRLSGVCCRHKLAVQLCKQAHCHVLIPPLCPCCSMHQVYRLQRLRDDDPKLLPSDCRYR